MRVFLFILTTLLLGAFLVTGQDVARAQSPAKAKAKTTTAPTAPVPDEDGNIPYVESQNPLGWNIPYVFQFAPKDPAYLIALKAMKPTYKYGTGTGEFPLIGLAQVNLDRDPLPEIIAFPTEEEEEKGNYCDLNGMCPHYIIQIQGKKAKVLGILYGWKINKGSRIVNGYYTLDAYKVATTPKLFEEYAYDPKTKEYGPVR